MDDINRRHFLKLGAAGLTTLATLPRLFSAPGLLTLSGLTACHFSPPSTLLSARNDVNGKHWCVAYLLDGSEQFRTEVPQRCHDVLQHPSLPLTAFIARRPGTHCYLIDTNTGYVLHVLEARTDRHFYGHGLFDTDGTLYLAENDTTDPGRGVLGMYRWANGKLEFSDEISTHGIEPHQFVWLPGNTGFAIANGGIRTEAGSRSALDEVIESSLVLMNKNGMLLSKETLSAGNSIRHIAVATDGTLVTAQQFTPTHQHNTPTLLAIKKPGGILQPFFIDTEIEQQLQGYSASVAINSHQRCLAVTAPRGNRLLVWNIDTGDLLLDTALRDCAGIHNTDDGFIVSSGEMGCRQIHMAANHSTIASLQLPVGGWDNHFTLI